MVTRALLVIRTESLDFLVYSITSWISRKGAGITRPPRLHGLTSDPYRKPGLSGAFITSRISRKGQALPGHHGKQGLTGDLCRKPGLSGVFHYQLDF